MVGLLSTHQSANVASLPLAFPPFFWTTIYKDFRAWCAENGLLVISSPRLRDAVMNCQSGISECQRFTDEVNCNTRTLTCLSGIRLRSGCGIMNQAVQFTGQPELDVNNV